MRSKVCDERIACYTTGRHTKKYGARLIEGYHAFHGSAAKPIQCLIVVADHHDIKRQTIREGEVNLLLDEIRILVLVDQNPVDAGQIFARVTVAKSSPQGGL